MKAKAFGRKRFLICVLWFEVASRSTLAFRSKRLRQAQRPDANHQRLLLREAIWLLALPFPVTTTSLLTSPLR